MEQTLLHIIYSDWSEGNEMKSTALKTEWFERFFTILLFDDSQCWYHKRSSCQNTIKYMLIFFFTWELSTNKKHNAFTTKQWNLQK